MSTKKVKNDHPANASGDFTPRPDRRKVEAPKGSAAATANNQLQQQSENTKLKDDNEKRIAETQKQTTNTTTNRRSSRSRTASKGASKGGSKAASKGAKK